MDAKPLQRRSQVPDLFSFATAFLPLLAGADVVTWDNSAGTALWSAAANWSSDSLPEASSDVVLPASLAGTITLPGDAVARTLSFGAAYHLSGGSLSLSAENHIQVDNGVTATLGTELDYAGDLTKFGSGTLVLAPTYSNPNSTGDLVIHNGIVGISSDATLGPLASGVQLAGGIGTLRIDASFESARTISAASTSTALTVSEGCEFSFRGQLAGSGFRKSGRGVMTFAPGVDSSDRGNAPTLVSDGILRVQGINNISLNGPVDVVGNTHAGNMGVAEFLRDEDTVFPHPVIGRGGTIHVDRSPNGTRENGRHTLGPLSMNDLSLRVTGGHGYGLTLGPVTISNSGSIVNMAAAPVIVPSVTQSTSGNFSLYGPVTITGAITKAGGSSGSFGLNLSYAKVRLGTSAAGLNGPISLTGESVLDTNNLWLAASSVSLTGSHDHPESPPPGPQLMLGSGILNLGGQLSFTSPQSTGLISGQLNLGSASRNFVIGNYSRQEELTVDGPISGSGSSGIIKSGPGLLRLIGAGNSFPGTLKVTAGEVHLGKLSGPATGVGGLVIDSGANSPRTVVTMLSDEQIPDTAPLSLTGFGSPSGITKIFLDLGDHTETVGALSLTYGGGLGSLAIKTGSAGKLILNGDLSFFNSTAGGTVGRQLMISGGGTLDLGAAVRTVRVAGNISNLPFVNQSNATIEARVANGGIIKTGNRTLFLTHPGNEIPGGIEVREGFIGPGPAGSLGTGPLVFTNAPGVVAGYDFGATTGIWTTDLTIPAGRDFEIRHSGDSPDATRMSGNIELERDLNVDVVVGSHNTSYGGTLDLSGVISDGPENFGLVKKGEGILKLGPANTFGGATRIERGTLWITAPGSLGPGEDPLSIDGGCLMAADSFILGRDVSFTARGGSLRGDGTPGMEITGHVDWGGGITSSFGAGTTILSGSTSGSGNFQLGYPYGFYTGWATGIAYWDIGESHCLSLRGPATLPSGNLQFDRFAVLELGNGDFTLPLGTGPGEFQMRTYSGGGWAAHGADRTVNIGGSGEPLTWGQADPPFLHRQDGNSSGTGALVFGSSTGTHTVTLVNPLVISSDDWREIITRDGPAGIDARISGDLSLNVGQPLPMQLHLRTTGTLEITGALRGNFSVSQGESGTTIFRGANESREMSLAEGRWIIAASSNV